MKLPITKLAEKSAHFKSLGLYVLGYTRNTMVGTIGSDTVKLAKL